MSAGDRNKFPLALDIAPKPYRMLQFMAKYGKMIGYISGILIIVVATVLWQSGYGMIWIAVGVGLGIFATLMLNCIAELVDLIVDTMIPK